MPTSIIVLLIDHESAEQENDGVALTAEELHKQGGHANEDASGMYGYEGWNTVFSASDGLLRLIASEARS